MDDPAPELVDITNNDFCHVLLVPKFNAKPKQAPPLSDYELWFKDTKELYVRAFQQMTPMPKLKVKWIVWHHANV